MKPALVDKAVFKSSLDYYCKSLKPNFLLYRKALYMNNLYSVLGKLKFTTASPNSLTQTGRGENRKNVLKSVKV